MQARTEVLKF